jgi:hypothetical protein
METATWQLTPNMFGKWGQVQLASDAILTIEVLQLDGADGETLFSRRQFSDDDAKRLDKLKSQYKQ